MKFWRIAVLICGHMRTYKKTYESLYKYILEPYNPDVYIATWDTMGPWKPESSGEGRATNYHGTVDFSNNPVDETDIRSRYNPKKLHIFNYEQYKSIIEEKAVPVYAWRDTLPKLYHSYRVNSYISQYLLRYFLIESFHDEWWNVENGKYYTAVVLIRPDIEILSIPKNLLIESGVYGDGNGVGEDSIYVPGKTDPTVGWMQEIFFISSFKNNMKIGFLYNQFDELFEAAKRENRPHMFFEPHNIYYDVLHNKNGLEIKDTLDARIVR